MAGPRAFCSELQLMARPNISKLAGPRLRCPAGQRAAALPSRSTRGRLFGGCTSGRSQSKSPVSMRKRGAALRRREPLAPALHEVGDEALVPGVVARFGIGFALVPQREC